MKRSKLLYITAHLPSYQVPEAGQKTARMLLDNYAAEYGITMVCFYNKLERPYITQGPFPGCTQAYFFPISLLSRCVSILTHPFLPLNEALRAQIKAEKMVKKLILSEGFDLVHFEFTACTHYLKFAGNIKTKVVSEHDVTYQALERKWKQASGMMRLLLYLEYKRQKKWELKTLQQTSRILVHNTKDRLLLIQDGIPAGKIQVIRPYVNPLFKNARRGLSEDPCLLFWGAMNRPENTDAVEWLVQDILPLIQKKIPECKLIVAGANPSQSIKNLQSDTISITGFVEDPIPYFEKATIAVAPLRLGAGIKIKVLEALEAGLPVVATDVGAEGIEDERLFVKNNPLEFAEKVIELLRHSS